METPNTPKRGPKGPSLVQVPLSELNSKFGPNTIVTVSSKWLRTAQQFVGDVNVEPEQLPPPPEEIRIESWAFDGEQEPQEPQE